MDQLYNSLLLEMRDQTDFPKFHLNKVETKSKPPLPPSLPISFQPTYGHKHSYQRLNPSPSPQKFGMRALDKPTSSKLESSRENSQMKPLTSEGSMLSGSSSQSNLLLNEMGRKMIYELKDLQIKFDALQKEHVKLQKNYDKLLAQSKKNKERSELSIAQQRRNCQNVMSITTSQNQTQLNKGTSDFFDLSEIPINQNQSTLSPIPSSPIIHTPLPKQSSESWKLQIALKDKQRLQMDNTFLRKQLETIRNRMDEYLQNNSKYSQELQAQNRSLQDELNRSQQECKAERIRLHQIRDIIGLAGKSETSISGK